MCVVRKTASCVSDESQLGLCVNTYIRIAHTLLGTKMHMHQRKPPSQSFVTPSPIAAAGRSV